MRLSEFKDALDQVESLQLILPNGNDIPVHFHLTEVGHINKHFIDCGGTIRNESAINLQLYVASDTDHRLAVQKLKGILESSERALDLPDAEIEVEYQSETIGKYGISFDGHSFRLTSTYTDCLAKDNCGIPQEKTKLELADLSQNACCTPGGGCC